MNENLITKHEKNDDEEIFFAELMDGMTVW